ncbi:MAG: ComEC/Rec2 family competence protein [Alphaproteobacteria bacterium]|nr:ComEC/Rec2 family competence protein [Alphaproteobacteria bacterium]
MWNSPLAWLRQQLDFERERHLLWLPTLLGVGIGLYFDQKTEPAWLPWAILSLIAMVGGLWLRRWYGGRVIGWLVIIPLLGFSAAALRTELVATPMLPHKLEPTSISGRVTLLEPATSGWRATLDQVTIRGLPSEETPRRLQVKLFKLEPIPRIGDSIRFFGVVYPPSPPAYLGSVDFRRMAFFQGVGGQGFAMTVAEVISAQPDDNPANTKENTIDHPADSSAITLAIGRIRRFLSQLYDSNLPAVHAGLAKALITGERANIPQSVNDDFRASGLYHLLSISGLHMAIVGGWVFVGVRWILALIPGLSTRYAIKSWAAVAAIISSGFYWLLAGGVNNVPAERAFFGFSLLMLAIILGRQALSLRTLALVAGFILLTQPEMLLSPGFQMSFAASAGIIALYEAYGTRLHRFWQQRGWWAKPAAMVVALFATSLAATLTTTPISFYHFQQSSIAGILANLLAVPLTELVVMPLALLSLATMAIGLEGLVMPLLELSLELLLRLASWCASLPGSIIHVGAWSPWVLVLMVIGGMWLMIWQRRWRLWGLVPLALAVVMAYTAQPPAVMLSPSGKLWLVRLHDGQVVLSSRQKERSLAKFWLGAQRREADDALRPTELADDYPELRCGTGYCRLQRGEDVMVWVWQAADDDLAAGALAAACAGAKLAVMQTDSAVSCAAERVIDHQQLQETGTQSIWWRPNSSDGWLVRAAWPSGVERPWSQPNNPQGQGATALNSSDSAAPGSD